MRVYLEKTGSIIMHIDLYFIKIKAIFTVFKNFIISLFLWFKMIEIIFVENLHNKLPLYVKNN